MFFFNSVLLDYVYGFRFRFYNKGIQHNLQQVTKQCENS